MVSRTVLDCPQQLQPSADCPTYEGSVLHFHFLRTALWLPFRIHEGQFFVWSFLFFTGMFFLHMWLKSKFSTLTKKTYFPFHKKAHIWVTFSWRDIIPKSVFFFQSLPVDFSYMVHCRDPNFFPVALNYLYTPGNVFFVTIILDRGPMLLWGKMCPYLLSKHTFYPIAT